MTQHVSHPGSTVAWPQEVIHRLRRVFEFHQRSKLTREQWHNHIPPKEENRPAPVNVFESAETISLPTNVMPGDLPTVALLLEGIEAVPTSRLNPPHDLRTLASWLFLGNGIIKKQRTLESNGDTYPSEIYVVAHAVTGLTPGLYHYNPHEFSLRRLRDGLESLAALKRGRPDLDFLSISPAALLVSTVFSRSTWLYQGRGYRSALLDAGRLVENLVQGATALGMQSTTRLWMNDAITREVIGVSNDVPFEQAEAVQAMIAWTDTSEFPMPETPRQMLPPIARAPSQKAVVPYDLIPLIHEDCVGPGVAIREIRPPLTDTSTVPTSVPAYARDPVEPLRGGFGFGNVVMNRLPIKAFHRKAIPRDQFVAVSKLAMRGPSYYPMMPNARHASLVRPLWLVLDVAGVDNGVWYHHPQTDRWSMSARGWWRMETAYLSREQPLAGDASAVCFLIADLNHIMVNGGPDTYRLAHLEAGILAQRMQLAAEAQGLGAVCSPDFYDDEVREFFGLLPSGWEILYEVMIGVNLDAEELDAADLVEEEDEEGEVSPWRD